MKISQKGDTAGYISDITRVLVNHQNCCVKSNGNQTMVIVPNLNIIAHKNIGWNLLWDLTSEYRYQHNYVKKFFLCIYTLLIVLIVKLRLPFLKKRKLNYDDQYPAILGGNNRIRLVSACNQYALIHAINDQTQWSCDAVIKAIRYYSNCGSIHLPQVMSLSCGGYLEEQINGIALNRLTIRKKEKLNIQLNRSLNKFFDFQIQNSFKVSIDEFFVYKHDYLIKTMTDDNLVCINGIKNILSFREKIRRVMKTHAIDCAWTHGDLNVGNIFLSNAGKVYVIDWEYFGVRHQNYDKFVYSTNLRHSKSCDKYRNIIDSVEVSVLDILEECIFSMVNGKLNVEQDEKKLKNCWDALVTRLRE